MAFPKTRLATHGAPDEDAVIGRIDQLMRTGSGDPPDGEIWIGDDAAVVVGPTGPLLLATDAVVGGVHADLTLLGLDDLGWKALTVTLSDLAAMGARPGHALLTICAPPGTDLELLASGVAEAAVRWACPVVGGDLSLAPEVMVSVAVTGTLDAGPPAVRRSGARAGHQLFVTGPLGASAAGLRLLQGGERGGGALIEAHRRPQARLSEGAVARRAGVSAMLDVSDGLAIDLHRLVAASGVGADLEGSEIPVAPGATPEEAMGGGEDYVLLMAAADGEGLCRAFARAGLAVPVRIGVCTEEAGRCRLDGRPLERIGWEHRFG